MKTQINAFSTLLLISLLLFRSSAIFGQPVTNNQDKREARRENIQAQKVAFITQELQLTPPDAEKFWPVYNEFIAKKDDLSKNKRAAERDAKKAGIDQLSDKQAEDLINEELQSEQQILDLKKEYAVKFEAVIGPKKTVKFYQAERKFNVFLLKQLKDAHKEHQGNE